MSFVVLEAFLGITAPYIALVALILSCIAIVLLILANRRLSRLAPGPAGSLEETIVALSQDMKEMKEFRAELEKYLKFAEARLRTSVSGIGMVRFNPFSKNGFGGNQSFAVAFLDEKYSGVVLSSRYARDRVAIYGKPIEQGTSTFELTLEEQEAIKRAKNAIAQRTKA